MFLSRKDIIGMRLFSAVYDDFTRPISPEVEQRILGFLRQTLVKSLGRFSPQPVATAGPLARMTAEVMVNRLMSHRAQIIRNNIAFTGG